jgi:hypothetical protein
MYPADFAWWQLLLIILGAIVVCFLFVGIAPETLGGKNSNRGYVIGSLVWVALLAGLIAFVYAIIDFVEWAWPG